MSFLIYYTLSLATLWTIYKILLSQTTMLNLNRVLLLLMPILPVIIYFIGNRISPELSTSNNFLAQAIQKVTIGSEQISVINSYSFWDLLIVTYLLGAITMAIRFIKQFYQTIKHIKSIPFDYREDGVQIAYSFDKNTFSFFNYIHICNDLRENENVLAHELIHVKQKHSIDIVIYSFYSIVLWFHPIIHLLNSEIKLIHEYIADEKVSDNSSKATYANKLLNIYFGTGSIQFINQFNNQKFIKMRLKMLSKNGKKSAIWRYATVPALLVVLAMSVSSFTQTKNTYTSLNTEVSDPTYDTVDVMPEYKGGMKELFAFMGNNIKYPKQSANDGIEGKCMVEFVVTKTGAVKEAKVLKGVNTEIDAESIRVINAMPKWTPGIKDDKKVNVKMVLPITFKLDK